MSYIILETHCVFEGNLLKEVAVLWEDNGYVRGSYSDLKPKGGYDTLSHNETINPELFQRVAGFGVNLTDAQKEKFFPGKTNWSR